MDEITLLERLRSEVPQDMDVSGAESRWRSRAFDPAPPRRRWRPPLLLSVVAATSCAAVVGGIMVTQRETPAKPMANVVNVLDRAADRAAGEPAPRPGQFVYQETVERRRVDGTGRWYWTRTQSWSPVGGTTVGIVRQTNSIRPKEGEQLPPEGETIVDPCPAAAPLDRPYLGSVPADPEALLDLMAAQGGDEKDRGARLWATATGLIDTPAPPKVRAALYRAIAQIPGVRFRADAVDEAGRYGVAITRTQDGVRDELIFDRATHRYLGTRTVNTEPGRPPGAPDGTTFSSAELRTAITDHAPAPSPEATPANC
ncbi:CU044_5270 family protein [Spirillospora sp. NBC_00431]